MKEKSTYEKVLKTISGLKAIIDERGWELNQDLIIESSAKEEELEAVEKTIGMEIPSDYRKLFKCSKRVEFSYQFEEEMPIEFRENFSGIVSWNLNSVASMFSYYNDWLEASLDPKYNDETPISITQKVGIDKFPFLDVTNGDLIVMGKSKSEIVYLSHEGSKMHGKKLGNNLWDFLEFHIKIGFAGPEDWQFEPFYDFQYDTIKTEGKKVEKFIKWLNKKR
ncbi:SMI1/KNR4 family protein [Saprospiraceae bacterium]|nr:SMI1/KNR4 family protein [Saprospiraceae bacterium]